MKKFYLDLGITAYHFLQERCRDQFGFNMFEFKKNDLTEFINNFYSYLKANNYQVYIITDRNNKADVSCKDIAEKIISIYAEPDIQENPVGIGVKNAVCYYFFNEHSLKELSEKYENMDKDYFKIICEYEADRARNDYGSKVRNNFFKTLYKMNLENHRSDEKEEMEKDDENLALA